MICFVAVVGERRLHSHTQIVERAMQLCEVQGDAGRPGASVPPARRADYGVHWGRGESGGMGRRGGAEVPYQLPMGMWLLVGMGGQLWYA